MIAREQSVRAMRVFSSSIYFPFYLCYTSYMERYNGKNLENARRNRRERNATHQEAILWHVFLKKHIINFSRQYRMERYILDFYAPSIKLAIEIDGGQHYEDEAIAYDRERTALLQEKGVTVLRFTNDDIDKRLNATILAIEKEIEKLKAQG